jgi:histidinol dehydrogenase
MAFGTESVPQVNKIMGPGNAFVNEAKRQVFGPVGIDQLAGPSEIFVVADETGDPELIATDLLGQAEHDIRTRVGLITTDSKLAEETVAAVERQLKTLATAAVASESWRDYGEVVICADEAAMIAYSDTWPPNTCRSTPAIRTPSPTSCAITGRCSSVKTPAWSIPTRTWAPTTRCPPWARAAIPAACGSAAT